MTNSLELYKDAFTFAKYHPLTWNSGPEIVNVLRNYYLQLVTTIFYELTVRKNSPLISELCQTYRIDWSPKNFSLSAMKPPSNFNMSFDLYLIVYGFNVALAENLDSAQNIFDSNVKKIFRGIQLNEESVQEFFAHLKTLDESLGNFGVTRVERVEVKVPVEKIVEKRVEVRVPAEIIPDEQEKILLQKLDTLAKNRKDDEEKILEAIKKIQLDLQNELPRLQGTLKNISEIRDGIEYKTLEEPIYQLLGLFEAINDTARQHPKEDRQKGYDNLIRRCKSFSGYVKQSLEMLGAEIIDEINVPFDPAKHKIADAVRSSDFAKVSKILSVGLICKGQVRRKAEVEIVEPVAAPSRGISASEFYSVRPNLFGR